MSEGTIDSRVAPISDSEMTVQFGYATSFDDWIDLMGNRFVPLSLTAPDPDHFTGTIRRRVVNGAAITDISAVAHRVQRLEDSISQQDPRHLKLSLQIEGSGIVAQDGRECLLLPGDVAIYDTGRPYTLEYSEGMRTLVMMFPPNMLGISADLIHHLTAVRLRGDTGVGRVISPFMQHLAEDIDHLSGAAGARIVRSAFDLITALLSAELLTMTDQPDPWKLTLDTVKTYITANLGNPSLNTERIAKVHYMSPRQLQYLFNEEHQTVSGYIREQRLERCRLDLEDPAFEHQPIIQVAQRWGFLDPSHFSKLFKTFTGVSPRDYRALKLQHRTEAA